MKHRSNSHGALSGLALTVATGAAVMYLFDPDKGRRRRAIAREKALSLANDVTGMFCAAARDAKARMQGLKAMATRPLRRAGVPDDLVLIERVRARMGRVVSHPHAIQVGANAGRVTVSGPILAREAEPLLRAVRSVWGVSELEDHLVVHERPDSVPSLQGAGKQPRRDAAQENWSPALRAGATLGGALLALYGLRHRSLAGIALAGTGIGLATRGATNLPVHRLADMALGHGATAVEKSIHIDAPPEVVYDLWSACGNFPRFMSHVREVTELGGGRTHWVVRGPAGAEFEWNAQTTRAERPQMIAWRTEPDASVQHTGSVHFEPHRGGTRVHVKMSYSAAGALGHAVARMLGSDPRRQMDEDLARMKSFIEGSLSPSGTGAPRPGARAQPQALH